MYGGPSSHARGEAKSRRIIDALRNNPMTTRQIAEALDISESGAALQLRKLRDNPRRVHISGYYLSPGTQGQPAPIYSVGNRPHAEYTRINIPGRKTTSAERRQQIIDLLTERPRTMAELSEAIHIVREAVGRHMRMLRKPGSKQVYIRRWQHPSKIAAPGVGGDWAPVYAAGDKPDKKKPRAETPSERHQRLSKDDAYKAERRKKRRAHYAIEKTRKKPNSIFAALGI